MSNDIYQTLDYKRSRKAYVAQCTFEYLVAILVTDAFLAKLLTDIGINDMIIGVISSLISFSFLFQLLSIYLMSHLKNTKRTVIFFDTLSQLLFLSIYLVPFLPFGVQVKTTIVIIAIVFAYIFKYLILSLCFKWANSYVDPKHRGEYSAGKEMISLVVGIVFTLLAGQMIDHYESIGNLKGGFVLIAAAMLILNICNFISLLLIKNDTTQKEETQKKDINDVLKNTLGNKGFVNVIIMTVLWEVGKFLTYGFLGTFKTSDLLMSVGMIQIINMVANLFRLAVSKAFGRYSDRNSYASGYRLALIMAAGAFTAIIFCTQKTWWCMIIFTILYYISLAGINQNNYNITYSYVKEEYIVQAMAIKQSIAGTLGFCASLVGSKVLQYVQKNGNTFWGMPVYGQQVLATISLIFIIAAIIFNKQVIEKQGRLVQ